MSSMGSENFCWYSTMKFSLWRIASPPPCCFLYFFLKSWFLSWRMILYPSGHIFSATDSSYQVSHRHIKSGLYSSIINSISVSLFTALLQFRFRIKTSPFLLRTWDLSSGRSLFRRSAKMIEYSSLSLFLQVRVTFSFKIKLNVFGRIYFLF